MACYALSMCCNHDYVAINVVQALGLYIQHNAYYFLRSATHIHGIQPLSCALLNPPPEADPPCSLAETELHPPYISE